MNKIKIFSVIISICILLTVAFVVTNNSINKHVQEPQLQVNFLESYCSDEELIEYSDLIVSGTVLKHKEKSEKPVKSKGEKNEEITVVVPVDIYEIGINDSINNKKEEGKKKIEVVITDPNIVLDVDKEYIFLLYKITGESDIAGLYGLVSYSQGLYTIDEESGDAISLKTKEKVKYSDLKSRLNKN